MKSRTGTSRFGAGRSSPFGFTLLEVLVVMAMIAIIAAIGIPALQLLLVRGKLQGSAREIAVHLGSSRVAAMRLGRNVVVQPRFESGTLVSFVDDDDDLAWDVGEDELHSLPLPGSGGTLGVYLMGPDGIAGAAGAVARSIDGLTASAAGPVAVFEPDGSIRDPGGIRVADGRTPPNVFEVRVDPPATARVEILKFVFGATFGIDVAGDDDGKWVAQGGNGWEWY